MADLSSCASSDTLPYESWCWQAVATGEVLEEEENRLSILLFLLSMPHPTSSYSDRAGAEEPVAAQKWCP